MPAHFKMNKQLEDAHTVRAVINFPIKRSATEDKMNRIEIRLHSCYIISAQMQSNILPTGNRLICLPTGNGLISFLQFWCYDVLHFQNPQTANRD